MFVYVLLKTVSRSPNTIIPWWGNAGLGGRKGFLLVLWVWRIIQHLEGVSRALNQVVRMSLWPLLCIFGRPLCLWHLSLSHPGSHPEGLEVWGAFSGSQTLWRSRWCVLQWDTPQTLCRGVLPSKSWAAPCTQLDPETNVGRVMWPGVPVPSRAGIPFSFLSFLIQCPCALPISNQ